MTAPAAAPAEPAAPNPATADPAPTATGVTPRRALRAGRGPVLLAVLVGAAAVLAALLSRSPGGTLDPRSYAPAGSRAVAALLEQRGVPVTVRESLAALRPAADSTLVVPFPAALTGADLTPLVSWPGRLVLVGAAGPVLDAVAPRGLDPAPAPVEGRRPACDLPAAVRAGDVDLGGVRYRVPRGATGCYATGGRATLVVTALPDRVLLGAGTPLTNDRLARRGNAALAVGLLGTGRDVQWLLPRPGAQPTGRPGGLRALLPDAVRLGALQLAVVVLGLALWRARRLGPVTTEPLPVVVPAAESVHGRGRLYRAARARGTAGEALRAAARERLRRRVGQPLGAGREAVVAAVAARAGRDAAAVDRLLYGAEPADDRALVALADDLDALDREVTGA